MKAEAVSGRLGCFGDSRADRAGDGRAGFLDPDGEGELVLDDALVDVLPFEFQPYREHISDIESGGVALLDEQDDSWFRDFLDKEDEAGLEPTSAVQVLLKRVAKDLDGLLGQFAREGS